MQRGLLDAYFRYTDRKSEQEAADEPVSARPATEGLTRSYEPLFAWSGMYPTPSSVWPDTAATAAPVNVPDAGLAGGLLWPMMPAPQQPPGGARIQEIAGIPILRHAIVIRGHWDVS